MSQQLAYKDLLDDDLLDPVVPVHEYQVVESMMKAFVAKLGIIPSRGLELSSSKCIHQDGFIESNHIHLALKQKPGIWPDCLDSEL